MKDRKKAGLIILTAAAVVPVLLVLLAGNHVPSETVAAGSAAATEAVTRQENHAAIFGRQSPADIPVFVTGLENLPASLQGTEVDGALEVDAAGRLLVGNRVRQTFDYFLTTVGEEPLDTVLARLKAYIRHKLPPGAAAEAEKMLADYLAYRQALAGIQDAAQPAGGRFDESAVREALQEARELRGEYMTAEMAGAFYADEDTMNDYMLDRVVILQDGQLTATERAGRLAEIEAQLPDALREATHVLNQYRDLQALTSQWTDNAGSDADLRQIRENLLGAEAADRLEALDRTRADWDGRLTAWLSERSQLRAASGLDDADRQQQIDARRSQHFSDAERLRVEALEQIADQDSDSTRQ